MKTQRPLDEYFIPEPNSGCWLWLGAVDQDQYGVGWDVELRRNTRAHRMVYEILVAPIPEGKKLLHRCDNPCCVNPDHMVVGTTADNNADCKAKGRNAFGVRHPMNKISEDQAIAIRKAEGRHQDIGAQFGVSKSLVTKIKAGALWKNL